MGPRASQLVGDIFGAMVGAVVGAMVGAMAIVNVNALLRAMVDRSF